MAAKADPAALLKSLRKSVADGEDGELLCSDIMQEVVQRAEEQILLNYFDRTAIPYTVQSVCKEMLDLIQFVFVARDAGDIGDEAAESWEADEEPEPCPTDTWARGAVPVRKRAAPDAGDKRMQTPSKREPKRAAASTIIRAAEPTPQTPSDVSRNKPPGKAGGVPSRRAQAASTSPAQQVLQTQDTGDDDGDGDRNEARRRREMRDASEKQNATLRELKPGREYTVDSINGKVIQIKPVDPRRLPSKRLDMKYDIEADRGDNDRRMSVDERPARAPTKKKKEGKNKWSEHVQPEDTHGPMVVGAAASPGVTMREGDQVQKSDLKNPKGRMTKTEYKKMMDQMGFTAQSMDITTEAVETKKEEAKPVAAPTPAERRTSRVGGKITGGPLPASPQMQATPANAGLKATPAKKKEVPRGGRGQPATLKPQAPAPVPALVHSNIQGQLDIVKPRERHTTGYTSPERQRKVTLAHPLFGSPSEVPEAASPTTTTVSRARQGIVIAPDIEGNEIAEDFLHGLDEDDFA